MSTWWPSWAQLEMSLCLEQIQLVLMLSVWCSYVVMFLDCIMYISTSIHAMESITHPIPHVTALLTLQAALQATAS